MEKSVLPHDRSKGSYSSPLATKGIPGEQREHVFDFLQAAAQIRGHMAVGLDLPFVPALSAHTAVPLRLLTDLRAKEVDCGLPTVA
jgi:hypothetical protein